MLSWHRTLSLRYLRLRWGRALLVVLSIALGVALLVGTRVLNHTMQRAALDANTPLAGACDLMVSNSETGVPGELAEELRQAQIPGVLTVQPLVFGDARLPDLKDRSPRAKLLGVELAFLTGRGGTPPGVDRLGTVKLKLGLRQDAAKPWDEVLSEVSALYLQAWVEGRYFAVVGHDLAAQLPDESGRLRVSVLGREYGLLAAGTITGEGHAAFLGGDVVVLPLEYASKMVYPGATQQGYVSRIDIFLEENADRDRVRQQVQAVVGDRWDLTTPEANDQSLSDVTGGLEVGFTLTAYAALVVGLFLVYNAMAVSVAERRHDIGVLRSLGATRPQVAGLFLGEAALLGLAGSALGVPLGWAFANLGAGPIQGTLRDVFAIADVRSVPLTWPTALLALSAGTATALLAGLVPALLAAREEPADAVRRVPRTAGWAMRLALGSASAGLMAAGALMVLLRDWLPPRAGAFGGVALIAVGSLFASPLLAEWLGRLFQPVARRLLGLYGRLAADNLARSPGRTGLVIGVMAVGVALMLQTVGVTESSESAILNWIEYHLPPDLFVTSHGGITSGGKMLPMDAALGDELAADPELRDKVEYVVPFRIHMTNFRTKIVSLIAFDAARAHEAMRDRPAVPGVEFYPRLGREPGSVVVSENFAVQYGVAVGDEIEVRGKDGGPVKMKVIGTLTDYTWSRGTILLDRAWYLEKFGNPQVDWFHVYVRRGADPEQTARAVRDTINRKWGAGRSDKSLVALTRLEVRDGIQGVLRRLYTIAFAQQLVVGLVVALGVIGALLISVLQRRRELGLLRAVGASQGQVLLSVLAEALLMGVIGSLIGLLVGIPLEWYVVRFIFLEETGILFPVVIPWASVGIVIGSTVLVATLAGLLPAARAMRLRICEAIAYE